MKTLACPACGTKGMAPVATWEPDRNPGDTEAARRYAEVDAA